MTVAPRFIPRITPMKGELPITKDLTVLPDGRGVTYPGETQDDRDRHVDHEDERTAEHVVPDPAIAHPANVDPAPNGHLIG